MRCLKRSHGTAGRAGGSRGNRHPRTPRRLKNFWPTSESPTPANIGVPNYSVPDGAATLTSLRVQAVGLFVPKLPAVSKSWVMAGGGARNRTLVKMLNERLAPATVETADEAGLSADALEAQAYAYLLVRVLNGLPCALPAATGVSLPMAGGIVARP